jgi:predicted phosphatase
MKERQWTELVTSLQYGQCILVLGPEIQAINSSTNEEFQGSSRDYFKNHLIKEIESEGRSIQENHFRAVAQQYEDDREFGAESLRAETSHFFGKDQFEPSEPHMTLADLPFLLTISTNHDRLFEKALQKCGKEPKTAFYNFRGDLRDNMDPDIPNDPSSPLTYYLFGHIDNPNSLVLSENDLADFLIAVVEGKPPIPNSVIKEMRKGGTILFIGFGLRHWYLRVLLKVFLRALELHQTGSKIVTEPLNKLDETDLKKTIYFYKRGIRIHVNNSDILPFIEDLKDRLEKKGGFVGQPNRFISRPKVFISYAREDENIAKILYSSLSKSDIDPWIDQKMIEAGDQWEDDIKNGIKESDFVLIICSQSLKNKKDSFVNKEIKWSVDRAQEVRGKFIIPVHTDDARINEIIPELGEIQYVNIGTDNKEKIKELVSILKRDYQRRRR